MKIAPLSALALCALVLAACQGGSFGGIGSGGSVTPPVNGQPPNGQQPQANAVATAAASPSPSTPPGESVTYPFSQAPQGFKCPESHGYSCFIRFNVTNDATPSPDPHALGKTKSTVKASPTPSPSPTPTPSPTPSASGAPSSPGPSASPSASPPPSMTIVLGAEPKDVPKMTNPDPKAVATVPLVSLRVHADQDVLLDGKAIAEFTLPQSQVGGRSFAIQLYHEAVNGHGKHKSTSDQFFGSYAESKLDGTMLRFVFTVPKLQVKKNETWLLVLYANEMPSASSSPAPSGSPSSSASPVSSPSPIASPH